MKVPIIGARPKEKGVVHHITCPGCQHLFKAEFGVKGIDRMETRVCPGCNRKLAIEVAGLKPPGLSGMKYEFSQIEAMVLRNFIKYKNEYENKSLNLQDGIHEAVMDLNETLRELAGEEYYVK